MKWLVVSLVVILGLAGCRAPRPSGDLLAPLGATRVPPPGTTSYNAKGTYYNRSAPAAGPAASGTPATSAPANGSPAAPSGAAPAASPGRALQTAKSPPRYLAVEDTWRSPRSKTATGLNDLMRSPAAGGRSAVVPASYNADALPTAARQGAVGTGLNTSLLQPIGGLASRLNGMPVSDATKAASGEPSRFSPGAGVRELTQLPRPAAAPATSSTKDVVATAQASDQAQNATAAASDSTLRWKTRPASGDGIVR